jgi:hypothetical protein
MLIDFPKLWKLLTTSHAVIFVFHIDALVDDISIRCQGIITQPRLDNLRRRLGVAAVILMDVTGISLLG